MRECLRKNTRAWVPHFLQPYWMVLAYFRQCNYNWTMCIRSEKVEIPIKALVNLTSKRNFHACYTSCNINSSIFSLFLCVFALFQSCCSHSHVFGRTLVHGFPISCSNSEYPSFFREGKGTCCGRSFTYQKLNYNNEIVHLVWSSVGAHSRGQWMNYRCRVWFSLVIHQLLHGVAPRGNAGLSNN